MGKHYKTLVIFMKKRLNDLVNSGKQSVSDNVQRLSGEVSSTFDNVSESYDKNVRSWGKTTKGRAIMTAVLIAPFLLYTPISNAINTLFPDRDQPKSVLEMQAQDCDYVVQEGDWMFKIIRDEFGMEPDYAMAKQFADASGIKNPSEVEIGDCIVNPYK